MASARHVGSRHVADVFYLRTRMYSSVVPTRNIVEMTRTMCPKNDKYNLLLIIVLLLSFCTWLKKYTWCIFSCLFLMPCNHNLKLFSLRFKGRVLLNFCITSSSHLFLSNATSYSFPILVSLNSSRLYQTIIALVYLRTSSLWFPIFWTPFTVVLNIWLQNIKHTRKIGNDNNDKLLNWNLELLL